MIYITFNWLYYVSVVGLTIQDGGFTAIYRAGVTNATFQLTLSCLFVVYYSVAWPICFCAYKEFKAMLMDSGSAAGGMMAMPGMGGGAAPP